MANFDWEREFRYFLDVYFQFFEGDKSEKYANELLERIKVQHPTSDLQDIVIMIAKAEHNVKTIWNICCPNDYYPILFATVQAQRLAELYG